MLGDVVDHAGKKDNSRVVISRELDEVVLGQMRCLGEGLAAGWRDNAVELSAVEPGAVRTNAAGNAERIGLVGKLANLVVGDSGCGKFLANLHGLFGAVEENILQISTGQ